MRYLGFYCLITFLAGLSGVAGEKASNDGFKFMLEEVKTISNKFSNNEDNCYLITDLNLESGNKKDLWYSELSLDLHIRSILFYEIKSDIDTDQFKTSLEVAKKSGKIQLKFKRNQSENPGRFYENGVIHIISHDFFTQYILIKFSDLLDEEADGNYVFRMVVYFYKIPLYFNNKILELSPPFESSIFAKVVMSKWDEYNFSREQLSKHEMDAFKGDSDSAYQVYKYYTLTNDLESSYIWLLISTLLENEPGIHKWNASSYKNILTQNCFIPPSGDLEKWTDKKENDLSNLELYRLYIYSSLMGDTHQSNQYLCALRNRGISEKLVNVTDTINRQNRSPLRSRDSQVDNPRSGTVPNGTKLRD